MIRLFSEKRLKDYLASLHELKGNKQVCETTVGMFQTLLLSDRSAMDNILEAIRKIQAHSAALVAIGLVLALTQEPVPWFALWLVPSVSLNVYLPRSSAAMD